MFTSMDQLQQLNCCVHEAFDCSFLRLFFSPSNTRAASVLDQNKCAIKYL